MSRLTDLLDLPANEAESTLCKLVSDKTVHAKIDRPAGLVNFTPKKGADELLNEWSGDLGKMLNLIEKTGHLINKVRFVLLNVLRSRSRQDTLTLTSHLPMYRSTPFTQRGQRWHEH
jgi:hypothetical protein